MHNLSVLFFKFLKETQDYDVDKEAMNFSVEEYIPLPMPHTYVDVEKKTKSVRNLMCCAMNTAH